MDEPLLIVLNGVLAILLLAFLYYAIILNRRLGGLRESRGELEKLITHFVEASSRAGKSIEGFKATADNTGRFLHEMIAQGGALREDLKFLIARSEEFANRLEIAVRQARPLDKNMAGQEESNERKAEAESNSWENTNQRPGHGKIRPGTRTSSSRSPERTAQTTRASGDAGQSSEEKRTADRKIAANEREMPEESAPNKKHRSRAERELLQTLRNMS